MTTAISYKVKSLFGDPHLPGDKSITHRALILSAFALGVTEIENGLESDDTYATMSILQRLGVRIERHKKEGRSSIHILGVGIGGLAQPSGILDCGNSGTAARLMSGVLSAHSGIFFMTGDSSLCCRPMERVITPLTLMGAQFQSSPGKHLPMVIKGTDQVIPITYQLPVASAQVKSALLLAGLNALGITEIIESYSTRDHTERLLQWLDLPVEVVQKEERSCVTIKGCVDFKARPMIIPADPSAAAFIVVAATLVSQSRVVIHKVMLNIYRTHYLEILKQMGAQIIVQKTGQALGHTVGTITIETAALEGIEVGSDAVSSLIDEYPILAIAAARAKGTTIFRGVGELRQKESDRLNGIIKSLQALGIKAYCQEDDLIIHGESGAIQGGCTVDSHHDHRLAMAFLILGMTTEAGIKVDNAHMIATSFPTFFTIMNELGGRIVYGK